MLDALPHSAAAGGELLPPAAPAMPDMDEVLRDFAVQHPNLAWLAQMIATQRAQASSARADEPACDPLQEEIDVLNVELDQALSRSDRLQRLVRRLAQELKVAHERLADLAAAFGACGLCWGEDPHCPGCRGRGKPGHFARDPTLPMGLFAQRQQASDASRPSTHPEPMKGDEP